MSVGVAEAAKHGRLRETEWADTYPLRPRPRGWVRSLVEAGLTRTDAARSSITTAKTVVKWGNGFPQSAGVDGRSFLTASLIDKPNIPEGSCTGIEVLRLDQGRSGLSSG